MDRQKVLKVVGIAALVALAAAWLAWGANTYISRVTGADVDVYGGFTDVVFQNAGTITLPASVSLDVDGDVDIDFDASTEEMAVNSAFQSTAALTYNQALFRSDLTHDGGAADVWDGAIVKIHKSNDANGAIDAVDGIYALHIEADDDAEDGDPGQPLVLFDDNRSGAESSTYTEATIYVDAEGAYALYIQDGLSRFNEGVYGFDEQHWTFAATTEELDAGVDFTLSALTDYDALTITTDVDDGGGGAGAWDFSGYLLSLDKTVATGGLTGGGYDGLGGLEIAIADGANVTINTPGIGHALMIDDNSAGLQADTASESSVYLDSERVYTLYSDGGMWAYNAMDLTIADNAVPATPNTDNSVPTSYYIEVTCNDADGCEWTLAETNMEEGTPIIIVNVSANDVVIKDGAAVMECGGDKTLTGGAYDTLQAVYIGDRWVMTAFEGAN